MGKKFDDIFVEISKEKGNVGITRLTLMTGVTRQKALDTAETPDLLKKFADGFQQITGKPCPVK